MKRPLLIPSPLDGEPTSQTVIESSDWIPIGYDCTNRGPRVVWAKDVNLRGPFFPNASVRSRWLSASGRHLYTPFTSLMRQSQLLAPHNPSGIIFHISRCGSTLVTTALKCDPLVTVLAESALIAGLFLDHLQAIRPPS